MKLTAAVLTISDSSFRGLREDLAGPRIQQCLREAGFQIAHAQILPDEADEISSTLRQLGEKVRLIVTTGGTGIARRDVTPEATLRVCDRMLEGVAELMRAEGLKQTPFAVLSRGVCGTLGTSLILNVPGSPKGAEQSLKAVMHLIPHALDLLAGKTEHSATS